MKQFILLLVVVLTLCSCKNDDDHTPQNPVDQLPPPTQTGENIFGYLLNGEPYVIKNTNNLVAVYQAGILQLGAYFETNNQDQGIIIWLDREIEVGTPYVLNEDVSNIAFFKDYISGCNDYETFNPDSGSITIDYIDNEQFIVSGRFEFEAVSSNCQETIIISNGRFDMQYIP